LKKYFSLYFSSKIYRVLQNGLMVLDSYSIA